MRLAILNNILPPYRIPIYRYLSERYDTQILLSGVEDNRKWETSPTHSGLRVVVVWGFTVKRRIRDQGRTYDLNYTHVNPGYIWALAKFRPHAVLSTEMGVRSLIALMYGIISRSPVWVWWGGTTHTERRRSSVRRLVRRFFARVVPRWISYGQTSTEYLESLGVPRHRVLQIQNCVDERLYLADVAPYPLDANRPRALFVGQLIARKGLDEMLDVAALLAQSEPLGSLVVVGDGPEASRFRSKANDLGLPDVRMLGHVPTEQMPSVYRACDFLVFPTLEDNWGLVVNEALLSGLPVIASKYAGCAEELLPARNVFDPLDPESFADAYGRALRGDIAPPDRGRLRQAEEVAQMIAEDVRARTLGPPGQTNRAGSGAGGKLGRSTVGPRR